MNAINNNRVYMRSLATRQANLALSKYVQEAVNIVKAAGYDLSDTGNIRHWAI